ncbi:YeeE/YedE family protein [bacterium BD-1]|uniref:DUF6691 family protein n=1 Tax=Arenimonas sp. TaxID=1872635 RepID=UPI001E5A2F58|nr:YeeE/YedE family protein [Ottowia caeni]
MRAVVALACGTLFGAGLTLAGMTDPARVIGFLDVAGAWDPSLAVVMASALAVALPMFQWALRRQARPVLAPRRYLPERTEIDRDLVVGALLFGAGWGIAGLCPGPAIAGLGSGRPELFAFVLAMAAGVGVRALHAARTARRDDCRS